MSNEDTSTPRHGDKQGSTADRSSATAKLNQAQAEFQRYMKRVGSQPGEGGKVSGGSATMAAGQGAMPGWAVPPSLAVLPGTGLIAGTYPAIGYDRVMADGSIVDRLGSTVRLGLDVFNLMLSGGARVLGGVSETMGYGRHGHMASHCGCSACSDCCCSPCDCCGCDCCQPRVGSCC